MKRGSLLILLASAGGFAIAMPASAQTYRNGNDLLGDCSASRDVCVSYVMGVVDAIVFQQRIVTRKKFLCIPGDTTSGRLADIVMDYLRERPENRRWSAALLVNNALVAAFPCQPEE